MKRFLSVFISAVMLAVCLTSFTACRKSGSGGGGSGSGVTAYIPINYNNYSFAGKRSYRSTDGSDNRHFDEGKAWKEGIRYCEELGWSPLTIAEHAHVLYMKNGKFINYTGDKDADYNIFSGNYKLNQSGEIFFENLMLRLYSNHRNEYGFYDHKKNEMEKSYLFTEDRSELNKIYEQDNDLGILYCTLEPVYSDICKNDYDYSRYSPVVYDEINGEYVNHLSRGSQNYMLSQKGDYLVTKQNSYSFKGKANKNSFVLKYKSGTDYDKTNFSIEFSDNGEWIADSDCYGKWWIFDDNILIIKTDFEGKYEGKTEYNYLYLDFGKEEIYLPMYMKCDDMLRYAEKAEKEFDELTE